MARGAILFLGGLIALLAAFAFKPVLVAPPDVPANAAPGTFDTDRAFARLARVIGDGTPHPVDSVASDGVRERLLAEMRAAGLEPRVSDAMVCNGAAGGRNAACARVRNLAATIGPAEGEHLLLVAHYDSVPVGPGASDAGIGIASLLEIAEQLRGANLQRPVTFLFNEGEESGLLGARAFLDGDPAAARVTTLVNLEARGVNGPAIMFETSRPNQAAIALYGGAVSRPAANSLSTDFYRLLPNSTDVAVFEERPWTILNLAIIGNETRYHSAGDDLAALDRRSLFHMGSQALQVAQAHVAGGETAGGGSELIYADVLQRSLVALPLPVGLVLLGLVVIGFGVAVVRRGAWRGALIACLMSAIVAALAAMLLTALVQWLRPGEFWRAFPIAMQVAAAATALLAMALCLGIARTAGREQLRVAAWFLIALTGAAVCYVAPGAAIYFLLAPMILLAGILGERWRPGAERAAAWIAAIVQLLTLLPIIALVELLLSTSPGWIAAPLAVLAALPMVIELRDGQNRAGTLAIAAAAIAGWAAVMLVPAYSEDRQEIFTVEHLQDRVHGRAEWGVYSDGRALPEAFDQWGPWERKGVSYARRLRWVAAAPGDDAPLPQAMRVGERRVEGGRAVTVRLAMNGWDGAVLQVPAAAHLRGISGTGIRREFGGSGGDYSVRCTGRSCDGFTFELVVGTEQPVNAMLVGNVARLPETAAPLVAARPALARPQYVPDARYAMTPVRL